MFIWEMVDAPRFWPSLTSDGHKALSYDKAVSPSDFWGPPKMSASPRRSATDRDDSHLSSPLLWRINGPALSYSLYLDNGFNGSCPMGFIHCDKSRGCGLFRVQVARLLWVRSSCGRHWTVILFMSEFCYIFNMHNRTEELIRLKLHMQPSAHAASKDTD